jgi:virginiamycin B lyase
MRPSAGLAASLFLTALALSGCGHGTVIGSGPSPTPTPIAPHVLNEYTIPTANSSPWTITTGVDGYLYFTENGASKIGRMSTGGAFLDIATPTANAGPMDIILGPGNQIWFTEQIGKLGTFTSFSSTAFTEHTIPWAGAQPVALTMGPGFNTLYFSDAANNAIGEYNVSAGIFSGPFAIPTAGSNPQYLVRGPDNNIWFCEYNSGKIGHFNVSTNTVDAEYTIPWPGAKPEDILVGQDNALWFTDDNPAAPSLGRLNASTLQFTQYPLNAAKSALGIVSDEHFNLQVADGANNSIGIFDINSKSFAEYTMTTASSYPWFGTLGPDGLTYWVEHDANKIAQFIY